MQTMDKLEKKKIGAVIITSANLRIEGYVFVPPDIRLSDELNLVQKKFLIVQEPQITSLESGFSVNPKVAFINKDEIILACPAGTAETSREGQEEEDALPEFSVADD